MNKKEPRPDAIEMARKYPFVSSNYQLLVRYTRKFREQEYLELRNRIQIHSKFQHQTLIKIVKAFESKKNHYFDIFYERVPFSFKSIVANLSASQLATMKQQLRSIIDHLVYMGIYPVLAEELIGYSFDKKIKLFLDIDYVGVTGNIQQIIKAKNIEIDNIFKNHQQLLKKKPSLNTPLQAQHRPTILNFQYNIHHNVSHEKTNQKDFSSRIFLTNKQKVAKDLYQYQFSDRKYLNLQPPLNLDGLPSKVAKVQICKSARMQKTDYLNQEQKVSKKQFIPEIISEQQKIFDTFQKLPSNFSRLTMGEKSQRQRSKVSKQLRTSIDKLNGRLLRLSAAIAGQFDSQKLKKTEQLNKKNKQQQKIQKKSLLDISNAVSQDDIQQNQKDLNFFTQTQSESNQNFDLKAKQQQIQKISNFQAINQKVRMALDRTQQTFKRFSDFKSK